MQEIYGTMNSRIIFGRKTNELIINTEKELMSEIRKQDGEKYESNKKLL